MKQFLLFSATILFFLSPVVIFSQTYKIDEKRVYSWDGAPNWKQETFMQYSYDNGGNKETKIETFTYPSMAKLFQDIKTYNGNNNIELEETQFWNSTMMQYINSARTTYTYDGSDNLEFETEQSYNFGTMMYDNELRTEYEFSGGNLIRITFQSWENGVWVNEEQYEYSYNTSGQPEEEIESTWNSNTSMWDPSERSIATYTNGLRTKLEVYEYNNGNWETQPFEQYLSEYMGTLETKYTWQSWDGSQWVNEDQETNDYDANGNVTMIIYSNWSGSMWEPYYKEELDYSMADPLSTTEFDSESFKVHPNPASDVINISTAFDIEKIEMYSVLGNKIIQSSKAKHLNVSNVKSGMYMLKIFSGGRHTTKKIVVK